MGITRARTAEGIKLTFSLDLDRPVSVVGDFNDWDPAVHPLKPRTNGKRSAVVTLPPGSRHTFRYLADGGQFFDDPEADGFEDNGYGGTHGVIVLAIPPRTTAARSSSAPPTRTPTPKQPEPPAPPAPKTAKPAAAKPATPANAAAKPAAAKPAAAKRPALKPKA